MKASDRGRNVKSNELFGCFDEFFISIIYVALQAKYTVQWWTEYNTEQTFDYSTQLFHADVKLYQLLSTLYSCLICFCFHPESVNTVHATTLTFKLLLICISKSRWWQTESNKQVSKVIMQQAASLLLDAPAAYWLCHILIWYMVPWAHHSLLPKQHLSHAVRVVTETVQDCDGCRLLTGNFWFRLTQAVLKKRPLNGCSVVVVAVVGNDVLLSNTFTSHRSHTCRSRFKCVLAPVEKTSTNTVQNWNKASRDASYSWAWHATCLQQLSLL